MSKHKSEDYKLSAVKYYLNNQVSLDDVCKIFDCPKQSLYRWIKRYEELEEIKRLSRKPISYKITNEQVKYAIQKLKENEQITMEELHKIVKKRYEYTPFCYFTDNRIQYHIDNLLLYKYDEFIDSKYFNDNRLDIVIKYNLTQFFEDMFRKIHDTDNDCSICMGIDFNEYLQCPNKHVICKECFKCLINKKECCVCRTNYDIQTMFYIKP
jgi:transposase-like protein